MRFACSLGWSVSASWHLGLLVSFRFEVERGCGRVAYLSQGKTFAQQLNLLVVSNCTRQCQVKVEYSPEPTVTLCIMRATPPSWQFLASDDTKDLLGLSTLVSLLIYGYIPCTNLPSWGTIARCNWNYQHLCDSSL